MRNVKHSSYQEEDITPNVEKRLAGSSRQPAEIGYYGGMQKHWPLVLILLAYLVAGSLYALYTPDWQAPDEPAHYNYIRQLAGGRLPLIEPGDYDQEYQERVIGARFPPHYSIEPFRYEDWQPPLYYLLQTPLFRLFDGALRPLRLFSVLLGGGVVLLAYGVAWHALEGRRWLALTAAAFVAFLPQHVAMMAAVNNDSLAELLIGAILLLLVRSEWVAGAGQQPAGRWQWPALGILLGLGFLTKATVYIMAPVLAGVLLWRYWGEWRALGRAGAWLFGPALLLGLLWWVRNAIVYDGLDFMAKAAHDAVVDGQLRTADWLAALGPVEAVRVFFRTTFHSFWGQFGWMGVPMPPWVYRLLLLFTGLVFLGLMVAAGRTAFNPPEPFPLSWFILAATVDLAVLVYLFYNLTFVQHQGRYLFPALIPISIGVAVGLGNLWRPFWRPWPRTRYLLPFGLAIGLFGLDLLALFRFILPELK
jgi:4-amino-4-deoxy-L-arabinose transferase-like glycosyltransferase